jgi:hypothetical protein
MAERQRSDLLTSAASGDEVAFRRIIAENDEDMRRVCVAIHTYVITPEAVTATE